MLCVLLVLAAVASDPSHSAPAHDRVVAASAADSAAALLRSEFRRVRAVDGQATRLLAEGVRRSPTFASLISAIQLTDVIVYVESRNNLPAKMGGRLVLQAVTARERYVRVHVRANLRSSEGIEVVAHELRHVLEIAAEPSVVDEAGLVALYERIGYPSLVDRGYDTDAAKRTGRAVRRELRG
jgi:hypothetical protein